MAGSGASTRPVATSTTLIAPTGQDRAASRSAASGGTAAAAGRDRPLESATKNPGAIATQTPDRRQQLPSTRTRQVAGPVVTTGSAA
jgi:hypothetical protein